MIHNDIQNQLQLLIKVSAPPLIEVAQHPIETPSWVVGQRLPAHVQAALPNGRFQVQVEDQILDMNLPRNTHPGETLELTFAGNTPRLTFILGGQQSVAQGHGTAQIAEHLQKAQAALSEAERFSTGRAAESIRNVQTFLVEAAKQSGGQRADLVRSAMVLLGEAIQLSGGRGDVLVRNAQAFMNEVVKQGGGRQAEFVRNVMVSLGEAMQLSEGQASAHLRNAQNSLMTAGRMSIAHFTQPLPDAPVSLSDAGKFVSGLLQQASQTASSATESGKFRPSIGISSEQGKPVEFNQPAAVSKLQPILAGPLGQGKVLAEALNTTISQSGLFYESHQLQWINGNRPLAAILLEPQAQLTAAGQRDTASSPVNLQILPLVQQQLEVLDSRQIAWQGQVWPGQMMRWEIEEDARQARSEGEDASQPAWNTRLHLELPRLGGVTANIGLNKDGVRIDFMVAKNESAAMLKSAQKGLKLSFEAAGLNLSGVTVQGSSE